uniref:histone acetyltransferase n=1 Tax=Micrurus paraensis TaxID=1970185 RepID=A0A2D4L989_9SAUR
MAENVVELDQPSAKRPKLSSPALSVSANDGTGNEQGMMQGQVMDGSVGAGRGCCNMSSPNPGMGNAGILMAETSQQGSPQMGGQASLRGPQPGAMNKDDDLGFARNNTEDHKQKMEKPGLGLDDGGNNQQEAATQSPADSRHLSIQRCFLSLVHACQCHNANCSLPSCQKMKRVVQHTKGCKRKTNGGCPVCKQLIALCCYHAKNCQDNKCLVPFCLNIKHKLRQQEIQRRL